MKRDVFQAIADPTRRAILVLLATQAMTPNALAEHFDSTRQAVSKHIQVLNECEMLQTTKQGREIYYRLDSIKMKQIDQWLQQFKALWEDRFNQLDDVLLKLKTEKDEK
jgi:DNA-binding transcriptional ArsR family regulator